MGLEKLSLNFIASISPVRVKPTSASADSPVSKYLEGLIARIDVPLLDHLYITFLIFDPPRLESISRTPKFKAIR
jgi:hypothetical protein